MRNMLNELYAHREKLESLLFEYKISGKYEGDSPLLDFKEVFRLLEDSLEDTNQKIRFIEEAIEKHGSV